MSAAGAHIELILQFCTGPRCDGATRLSDWSIAPPLCLSFQTLKSLYIERHAPGQDPGVAVLLASDWSVAPPLCLSFQTLKSLYIERHAPGQDPGVAVLLASDWSIAPPLCLSFQTLKSLYIERHAPGQDPGVAVLLACGTFSSSCGQLASYPLSLVRTKLQAKGDHTRRNAHSTLLAFFFLHFE